MGSYPCDSTGAGGNNSLEMQPMKTLYPKHVKSPKCGYESMERIEHSKTLAYLIISPLTLNCNQ